VAQHLGDILLVGNPSSRGGKAAKRIEQVRDLMNEMGLPHVFKSTLPNRETVGMVAESIADEGFRTVVYLGGDGTFYEVATGICQSGLSSEVRLGMLPSGTANDQGKSFGISASPRALEENVATIAKGFITSLDVGEVTVFSDDGLVMRRDLFFDSLGFGLSSWILAQRNRDLEITKSVPVINKIYKDHVVYVRAALAEVTNTLVYRDRFFSAEVDIDGEIIELNNLTDLVVKNTLIFAGDWIVDPKSAPDDGVMEVSPFYGIRDWTGKIIVNHKKFPFHIEAMERIGFKQAEIYKGRLMKIQLLRPSRDEPLPSELDGEEFLSANFYEVKVHPRLLNLIVPEHPHWI
jgi:diacylglycerol kinase family enzyme